MGGQTNPLHHPYEPLCGIVLIPPDRISEVHGELVMEVVIPFANCHEGSDDMVARCVFVIEWRVSQPMCKGVDAECALHKRESHSANREEDTYMVNKGQASSSSEEEATEPISPK